MVNKPSQWTHYCLVWWLPWLHSRCVLYGAPAHCVHQAFIAVTLAVTNCLTPTGSMLKVVTGL